MFPSLTDDHRREILKAVIMTALAVWVLLLFVDPVHAATFATDQFDDLYDMVKGWATGTLGKAIAVSFLIIGLIAGLLRGSVVAALTAVGAAVALIVLPSVIESIFTVTGG